MLIVSDRLRKSDGERVREIERAKQSKANRPVRTEQKQ